MAVEFTLPTFPGIRDLDYYYRVLRDRAARQYPAVPYRALIPPTEAEIDEVHQEVPEYHKRWDDPILLRAYALPSEESHPLTIFGIEELRDVVLFADVPCLLDAGLAVQDATTRNVTLLARAGDRFQYRGGVWYDVLEWRLGRTYGNSDVPVEYQAIAERVRLEAAGFEVRPPPG